MKTVLVQITKSYLCLTGCEPIKEQEQKVKSTSAVEKTSYSFTAPFLVPIEKEDLGEKDSLWEDPKLLAHLVKSGLRQMNNNEIKDVVLLVESFDLTCCEYQHIKTSKKLLNNFAIDRIKEFVGDSIDNFSVIYKDYSKPETPGDEVNAKAFALPKALAHDLTQAFTENMLNLEKIVPSECAMLYAAETSIYSFDKTVALISMDYTAVRIMIAKNGVPLYCHDFRSPIEDILNVIQKDRSIGLDASLDYLRTVGYGFQNEIASPSSKVKLDDIRENRIEEILRNIRLVLMSLNIKIDQIYLSDYIAYIPHIRNYFVGFGLTTEISPVSDFFNPSICVPEPSIQARDSFYKSGSFFIMNELMNSGNTFQDNLIYGLKAYAAKNVQAGKKLAVIGSVVLAAVMVVTGGGIGFLVFRGSLDKSQMADPKYDNAKSLIDRKEKITNNLNDQEKDAELLPRTKLYTEDVLSQLESQVVDEIQVFDGYNIGHDIAEDTGLETCTIPISGTVSTFDTFINLQNNIKKDGFFVMSPSFAVADAIDTSGYTFTTTVTATEKTAADNTKTK